MLKPCYLRVLALEEKNRRIVTEIGVSIYEFDELFQKKYFSNLHPGIDPDKGTVIVFPLSFWKTYARWVRVAFPGATKLALIWSVRSASAPAA